MLGAKLKDFDLESKLTNWAIKEPVFPFDKFPEVKKELGPEMKSTGESIYFMDDFNYERFRKPYEFKNLYLIKYTNEWSTECNKGIQKLITSDTLTHVLN